MPNDNVLGGFLALTLPFWRRHQICSFMHQLHCHSPLQHCTAGVLSLVQLTAYSYFASIARYCPRPVSKRGMFPWVNSIFLAVIHSSKTLAFDTLLCSLLSSPETLCPSVHIFRNTDNIWEANYRSAIERAISGAKDTPRCLPSSCVILELCESPRWPAKVCRSTMRATLKYVYCPVSH